MNKKGFLFVVTVFLILTYILLSISVWVKGIEASERAYSEFYKESTVELAIEQVTPAKVDTVTNAMMKRALFRVNEHAIDSSLRPGPEDDENQNIRYAFFELLENGSADDNYFVGSGVGAEENSSLIVWISNLNASLGAIGVYINDYGVNDFNISQNDAISVNYSFNLSLEMQDYTNTSSIVRTYPIYNSVNITGLVDPALARETQDAGETVYRQFFFNSDLYGSYTDVRARSVHEIDSGLGGQGWLYGPLASASGGHNLVQPYSEIAIGRRNGYILVGTYDEIRDLTPRVYNQFAGFIVTSIPTVTSSDCGDVEDDTFNPIRYEGGPFDCEIEIGAPRTGKPYIIAPSDFNIEAAPVCPILDGPGEQRCVLFVNSYLPSEVASDPEYKNDVEHSAIYGIEYLRDFVMCGYYTHSSRSPSYLQRLLDDPYNRSDVNYGIETFVIGEYAGDYNMYDVRSRLDSELFEEQGIRIRGLPGCKDQAMCSDDPSTGIFAVSTEVITRYGLDDIDCLEGAGCE